VAVFLSDQWFKENIPFTSGLIDWLQTGGFTAATTVGGALVAGGAGAAIGSAVGRMFTVTTASGKTKSVKIAGVKKKKAIKLKKKSARAGAAPAAAKGGIDWGNIIEGLLVAAGAGTAGFVAGRMTAPQPLGKPISAVSTVAMPSGYAAGEILAERISGTIVPEVPGSYDPGIMGAEWWY